MSVFLPEGVYEVVEAERRNMRVSTYINQAFCE